MKKLVLSIIDSLLNFNLFRKFIRILNWELKKFESREICKIISPDNSVLSGPFKGLTYDSLSSAGSALTPKILGSYEDELHNSVTDLIKNNYKTVIDIGSAEGYYAIGLAKILREAKVYAYDIDLSANSLCKKMALKNGVDNRVSILQEFNDDEARKYKDQHALLICDCEGFEDKIFSNSNISLFENHDIIIELHDLVVPGIQEKLKSLFNETHLISTIPSKLKHVSDYSELKVLPSNYYDDLILIERNTVQYWLVLKSKRSHK